MLTSELLLESNRPDFFHSASEVIEDNESLLAPSVMST